MQLSRRQLAVLQAVAEAYIDAGSPVGSADAARRLAGRKLASATVRTVMAELTAAGLLQRPHVRGGAVLTDAGLRAYVNEGCVPRLHPWDRKQLDDLAKNAPHDALPTSLGEGLARLSGQMAVLGIPRFAGSSFREIGIARCGLGRVVVFFVSPGGQLQQSVVDVDHNLSDSDLIAIQNLLNAKLTQRTLAEVRTLLERELQDQPSLRDRLRRLALELGIRALPAPETELVIEGTAQLAAQPEFREHDKLHGLLDAVERRALLLRVLERLGSTVTVMLGSEHQVSDLPDLACVGMTCQRSQRAATVALMGPARMDYSRLVPMVSHAAGLFERYWART